MAFCFQQIFISKYHQQGKALPINATNGTRKKKKCKNEEKKKEKVRERPEIAGQVPLPLS